MLLFFIAYLGGLLTIFSPCVLPVLPFIFTRPEQPFRRSGLPVLLGMIASFTLLASLATVGGAWLIGLNLYGRYAALLLFLLLGAALIFPSFSEQLMRPFVTLGGRLQQRADRQGSVRGALLLGVAIGFLWAPCAGPILGLILAGAALKGANLDSVLLLLMFALGAATSLGAALLAGTRVYRLMKQSLGAEEWLRRCLGITVMVAVIAIALGWDTRFLAKFSFINTAATEQKLLAQTAPSPTSSTLDISGATQWLNSAPLNIEMLRGKVVLIDFWTYSCINCLRTLPYLKAWDEKYRARGLVIIGVHAPEFAFEKDTGNVSRAIQELGIHYPVAMDNQYAIWNSFHNQYWPAHYLIDTKGIIRQQHSGEGAYQETETVIQTLLKEAQLDGPSIDDKFVQPDAKGATAAAASKDKSPETYLGYARTQHLASPEPIGKEVAATYSTPNNLLLNQWAIEGKWLLSGESATNLSSKATLSYQFKGRDLHLVLGAAAPVRFRVTLDNAPPGKNHGEDTDAQGNGVIREQRLYQLIRRREHSGNHTFRIIFLDPGAQAYAFTFG